MKYVWLLLFAPSLCYAQTISVSPKSSPIAGKVINMSKVSIGYSSVEAMLLFSKTNNPNYREGTFNNMFWGVFYKPVNVSYHNFDTSVGGGIFNQNYPNSMGTHLNFLISISYKISDYLCVEFSHISNGFNILHHYNPGTDNIGIKVHL